MPKCRAQHLIWVFIWGSLIEVIWEGSLARKQKYCWNGKYVMILFDISHVRNKSDLLKVKQFIFLRRVFQYGFKGRCIKRVINSEESCKSENRSRSFQENCFQNQSSAGDIPSDHKKSGELKWILAKGSHRPPASPDQGNFAPFIYFQ